MREAVSHQLSAISRGGTAGSHAFRSAELHTTREGGLLLGPEADS